MVLVENSPSTNSNAEPEKRIHISVYGVMYYDLIASLPQVGEQLSAKDAMGLERLLMDLNWTWLTRRADRSMFGFEAVAAFVFKWDMLRAWLECDPNEAKVRFQELIDKVTYVAEK